LTSMAHFPEMTVRIPSLTKTDTAESSLGRTPVPAVLPYLLHGRTVFRMCGYCRVVDFVPLHSLIGALQSIRKVGDEVREVHEQSTHTLRVSKQSRYTWMR
jgi:hypothetical protein